MKMKVCFLATFLMLVYALNAQRAAVLEFKANVGVSQQDVDGISAIFITYFQPAGYTMVERTQIDKVIDEQGFQRSKLTENQMVKIGQILNVSKIVVGDVNVVMGQYNVDVRVINVETGTIAATEGATFTGSSYRTSMQSIAQKLAAKIAISKGPTVSPQQSQQTKPQPSNSVITLYGYLHVFPSDIGTFDSKPTTIIEKINEGEQYGYCTWRIPTKEELSLLQSNNIISSYSTYISTGGSYKGRVRLVTDDATCEEVKARIAAEAERLQREADEALEQARIEALKAQGYVDLGLPSGTLWKDKNEDGGFYTYDQAVSKFGNKLPTEEQFEELKNSCQWTWNGSGYKVVGPSGNSIVLPAEGGMDCDRDVSSNVGSSGYYWSSAPCDSDRAWGLDFGPSWVGICGFYRCDKQSVRLVQD